MRCAEQWTAGILSSLFWERCFIGLSAKTLQHLLKPSDSIVDKTRKIHDDYIYDFVFDDGHIQNIYLLDKQNIARNKVQIINQFKQMGAYANRYDVTILVNGLPLVQVELKKRGVAIREAFNQVHRYSKESFNSESSLYKYLQMFVISNGTDTRYFANTVKRDKNSFDFTMNWAQKDNTLIKDLKDFTATFFQKNTLLQVLLTYSVFDTSNTLLIMRPYQIAAAERILWKIKSANQTKKWSKPEGGGYIWHTTGSGKTLTSFKAARLATQLDFIDKVFFVVDRKDLDYQTMQEYQRFSPDSVNGSESTAGLKRNIEQDDNKIIVTTIQKLNNLMKSESDLSIYQKQVVFIFDECHRSQFGEAQKNLQKKFKRYYQFGFTGTPIFPENALGAETTASVFGRELHSYVITDAIRDEKVLKFKVDYNDVRPAFKALESEQDEAKISAAEEKQLLLHPDRIKAVAQYILQNFRIKTHRTQGRAKGFNAMFAVSSVEAAKLYYQELNALQKESEKPLKIATIFSFSPNEMQNAVGEIVEENFEPSAMDSSAKEFLAKAISDYNRTFQTAFGVDSKEFQNYYRDLAKRVKSTDVDLLIVVGMFFRAFKDRYFLTDEAFDTALTQLRNIDVLSERAVQDYRSTYNDIRDWFRCERVGKAFENAKIDWDDVVFEVDLLKSQEIDLDYILELIFDRHRKTKEKSALVDEVRRMIRSGIGNRAKESLIVDFINETDFEPIEDRSGIIEAFFVYAQKKQREEAAALIAEESLNEEAAKRYIQVSLKREYTSENGTDLNAVLPKLSPLNPQYLTKKHTVFQKITAFIERFKGVGGEI